MSVEKISLQPQKNHQIKSRIIYLLSTINTTKLCLQSSGKKNNICTVPQSQLVWPTNINFHVLNANLCPSQRQIGWRGFSIANQLFCSLSLLPIEPKLPRSCGHCWRYCQPNDSIGSLFWSSQVQFLEPGWYLNISRSFAGYLEASVPRQAFWTILNSSEISRKFLPGCMVLKVTPVAPYFFAQYSVK